MFKTLPLFFKIYAALLVPLVSGVLLFEHGEIVLWVNAKRTSFLDATMPFATYLGDGVFYATVAVVLIIWNWRLGLFVGLSGGIMSGVVSFLKRVVFEEVPRPKRYFADTDLLQFIEGVKVAGKYSFPSGHSTTIFMICAFLSLIFYKNKTVQWILVPVALTGAFSRIYLLQHFYVDVVAGSILGIALALICWKWLKPLFRVDQLEKR